MDTILSTLETNATIETAIATMRSRIKELAAEGRTMDCDTLHAKIGTLEETLAVLNDEDDAVQYAMLVD